MFQAFTSALLLLMIRYSLQGRSFRTSSLLMRSNIGRLPSTGEILKSDINRVKACMDFIDASPEPFHCVNTAALRLEKEGFCRLDEGVSWMSKSLSLENNGKYYFTKGGSTIVAFVVGGKYIPGEGGFKVIGAHTDSPNLKLKPVTKRSGSKLVQLNVECYGGGLWHTWFDRDLSLAGRVILRNHSDITGTTFSTRLLNIKRPILRIPNLCIHLRTPDERETFKVNKEDHLMPILCDEVAKVLGKSRTSKTAEEDESKSKAESEVENDDETVPDRWAEGQQPELLTLIAEELNCQVEDIADFELSMYDVQSASQAGLRSEYICSGRLDNLASCFVSLDALETYSRNSSLVSEDSDVSVVALFDHEEVGSGSAVGAGSTIMQETLDRIHKYFSQNKFGNPQQHYLSDTFKASLTKSLVLSVDMAHAVHPNYASKHDKAHSPHMNGGVVIKTNANQRYATGGLTGFLARELGRRAGVPVQEFAVRNDCPCGSTIGPIISQNLGVRAVDLGMPQLSMHSIREMMGATDLTHAHNLFLTFFSEFRALDSQLKE